MDGRLEHCKYEQSHNLKYQHIILAIFHLGLSCMQEIFETKYVYDYYSFNICDCVT